MRWATGLAVLLLGCWPQWVAGHEVRPALLALQEQQPAVWQVVWKEPLGSGGRLGLQPVFGPDCPPAELQQQQTAGATLLTRMVLRCALATVAVAGLERTITDVMVTVRPLAGEPLQVVLRPAAPPLDLAEAQGGNLPVAGYFVLGVQHLLGGLDHVLFVLGLLLLVPALRPLVATITAFTVAHSLTLALSTLGWLRLAQGPVEACIALSLVLLAVALVRAHGARRAGQPVAGLGRRPWLLAFAFGLLHGFGFAGVLADLGLPAGAAAWALLLFNLGVEAGQLLLIAAALALLTVLRQVPLAASGLRQLRRWPALEVALGAVATFWLWQRLLG